MFPKVIRDLIIEYQLPSPQERIAECKLHCGTLVSDQIFSEIKKDKIRTEYHVNLYNVLVANTKNDAFDLQSFLNKSLTEQKSRPDLKSVLNECLTDKRSIYQTVASECAASISALEQRTGFLLYKNWRDYYGGL